MKKSIALILSGVLAGTVSSVYAAGQADNSNDNMDKVSYTIGYEIGHGFNSQNVDVTYDDLKEGLKAGLQGNDSKYSKEQMQTIMQNFQKEMMAKAVEKQKEQGSKNIKNAQAGMKAVASQKDIKKLEDGIYYQVIKQGNGDTPAETDTVKANYQGNILTAKGDQGKLFDSSYERGQPAMFPVDQVIPCWTKILQKMPVGSTWQIYCAPKQAYGKNAPPSIGPNQALTFKVDLLAIKGQKAKDSGS